MAMQWVEDDNGGKRLVIVDSDVNSCPADPQDALQCDSCQ